MPGNGGREQLSRLQGLPPPLLSRCHTPLRRRPDCVGEFHLAGYHRLLFFLRAFLDSIDSLLRFVPAHVRGLRHLLGGVRFTFVRGELGLWLCNRFP